MPAPDSYQDYQRKKAVKEWEEKLESQRKSLSNAQRIERATEWKRIGNDKFKSGNLPEACGYYREAIFYIDTLGDVFRKEKCELLMPLYSNLGQVYLRQEAWTEAAEACGKAIDLAGVAKNQIPGSLHAKALFRRGVANVALERWQDAKEDLQRTLKLQPKSEEAAEQLKVVEGRLDDIKKRLEAERLAEKEEERKRRKQTLEEQRRQERLVRAKEKQQMETAFKKLSEGSMLYEQREKEMEPVRQKEAEKRRTLELEQNLTNILDEAKGVGRTDDFEKFMAKKLERSREQCTDLDQKKKILDKKTKEEQWDEDDSWKQLREQHRQKRLQEEQIPTPARNTWETKEVARWCEQRLREMLLHSFVDSEELDPRLAETAATVTDEPNALSGRGLVMKAVVTDILKLEGDAAVIRLNPHKPPLHFFDYFLKLEWEVSLAKPGEEVYRSAEELISSAAKVDDGKAPKSITKHRLMAGTLKNKEFTSDDTPEDGISWPLARKIKKSCEAQEVSVVAGELVDKLRSHIQGVLSGWVELYKEYW